MTAEGEIYRQLKPYINLPCEHSVRRAIKETARGLTAQQVQLCENSTCADSVDGTLTRECPMAILDNMVDYVVEYIKKAN